MKLKGKVAFITGASTGIGRAVAIDFAKLGCDVILTARRMDKLEMLRDDLIKNYGIDAIAMVLDVTKQEMVKDVVSNLGGKWGKIDILVNNAGLALSSLPFQQGELSNWDTMIDVNLKGLLYVTHNILPLMLKHNSGHIVNIGSIAGCQIYPGGNVYSATKHAVRAISQSLRVDLLGTPIRVTEIAPGAVGDTEFSTVRWNSLDKAKEFYSTFTPLEAQDIADSVSYCVTRSPHINISEMLILPTDQASANHLHRNDGSSGSLFNEKVKG